MSARIHSLPKIQASAIVLERVRHGGDRTRVEVKRFSPDDDVWERADRIISGWRAEAPLHDEFYDRVEFVVFFENGATFVSFLVLQYAGGEATDAGPSDAPTRLADEVRSSAQMFAGHRRPAGFSALQYVEMLRCYGRASRESYENMLRYYEIPSAGTAGTAAGQSVLLGAHAHHGEASAGSDEGPQSA
jgi:hypothetical protein